MLVSLGLRIAWTDVSAGMLYVVKLIVDAVVAGRADPAFGVPETDCLTDPGLRHWSIGKSSNDGKKRRGDGPDLQLQGHRESVRRPRSGVLRPPSSRCATAPS
jgi:hypothetical protein